MAATAATAATAAATVPRGLHQVLHIEPCLWPRHYHAARQPMRRQRDRLQLHHQRGIAEHALLRP